MLWRNSSEIIAMRANTQETHNEIITQPSHTPPEKNNDGKAGFQGTKSGAGEQFPPQDCRAKAPTKGVCLFTDTGILAHGSLSARCV